MANYPEVLLLHPIRTLQPVLGPLLGRSHHNTMYMEVALLSPGDSLQYALRSHKRKFRDKGRSKTNRGVRGLLPTKSLSSNRSLNFVPRLVVLE